MIITNHSSTRFITKWLLTCLFTIAPVGVVADEQQPKGDRPGENYSAGEALTRIETARRAALENNKLVLVVMGANWCHDSRALAARLDEAPLNGLISDHYELVFVDVGNLNKGKDVITSLGEPVWYATPSVLIIDPVSGKLVNANNRHQWGSAANINMQKSVAYFQLMANTDMDAFRMAAVPSPQLAELLEQIDRFEEKQAERLYQAYAILSPMLEAYNEGDHDKWSDKTWNEVSKFRMQLPIGLDALRKEARERVANRENNIKLKFPRYPAFSWEKNRDNE